MYTVYKKDEVKQPFHYLSLLSPNYKTGPVQFQSDWSILIRLIIFILTEIFKVLVNALKQCLDSTGKDKIQQSTRKCVYIKKLGVVRFILMFLKEVSYTHQVCIFLG